jgi:hypothetical protein
LQEIGAENRHSQTLTAYPIQIRFDGPIFNLEISGDALSSPHAVQRDAAATAKVAVSTETLLACTEEEYRKIIDVPS